MQFLHSTSGLLSLSLYYGNLERLFLGSNSANENHARLLQPEGGRCAVETVDEPEALNDPLLPNLEGALG